MSRSKPKSPAGGNLNRRDFCRSATCMIAGGGAASVLPSAAAARGAVAQGDPPAVTAVSAEVISQKGTCAIGHKPGDRVIFTEEGVSGRICIHALYSMMPAVFAMMFEARFPWLKDPDSKTHACPDAFNPVVFRISRQRG